MSRRFSEVKDVNAWVHKIPLRAAVTAVLWRELIVSRIFEAMMSGVFTLPRRSIAIVLLSALVSLLRWLILVVIALLLTPYVLAHVEQRLISCI